MFKIEIGIKLQKQVNYSGNKLQSFASRDCNCNRLMSNTLSLFDVLCCWFSFYCLMPSIFLHFIFSICSREKIPARTNNIKEDVKLFKITFGFCFKLKAF